MAREVALGRSDHESRVKEEKTSGHEDHHPKGDIDIKVPPVVDHASGPIISSTKKEEVEELEIAKTEMGEVREENQRLKQCLDRVMKDYKTLELKFKHIFQNETNNKDDRHHFKTFASSESESDDLVSLTLGRLIIPSNNKEEQKSKSFKASLLPSSLKDNNNNNGGGGDDDLALGLECKFETTSKSSGINPNPSPSNSSQERPPPVNNNESRALKKSREDYCGGEDEVSQHNPPKRARVCVRARCDAPTMNDGCQWRKYGQKISKGNPCPRAYYRCTVAPSCPVKKQVQRCAEDMSILITTYEGIHNHPLPLSATAIASTTSAAASMLLSSSSSSSFTAAPTSSSADLYGLNFSLSSDGSFIRSSSSSSKPPLYFSNNNNPNPSSLSSSSIPSHPTITLDLTTTSAASRFMTSSSSNYNPPPPRSSLPSSTSLNFSSPNNNNFLSYSSNIFSSMNLPRSSTMDTNVYRVPYMQKNSAVNNSTHRHPLPQPPALPDSVAAATKAITADPKFQSALAVALSSFISTGGDIGSSSQGGNRGTTAAAGETLAQKMKWGELFPAL